MTELYVRTFVASVLQDLTGARDLPLRGNNTEMNRLATFDSASSRLTA